jgi:hypothetical protein
LSTSPQYPFLIQGITTKTRNQLRDAANIATSSKFILVH